MKLELEGVGRSYGSLAVLREISARFELSGGALVLIGPSGSGKSTLLRLLCGLEAPSTGRILWDSEALPADLEELRDHRSRVGVVFQDSNLFPHLDAMENILLPLEKVHGVARPEALDRARAQLARFKLEKHAQKRPWQLSGGQKQRVALARALALGQRTILLDEPTSALDPEMTWEVLQAVEEVAREGCSIILSTHEIAFARRISTQAVFLYEGRILEAGAGLFEAPRCEELRAYLSKVLLA
jgi:polar amino acid transport system ATP-binding protein